MTRFAVGCRRAERAPKANRLAVLLASGGLALGCSGQGPDATELCSSCVLDQTELGATGTSSGRDLASAPEYAFLQQPSLSLGEIDAAWQGLPYERIGLTRTSCFANCPEYSVLFIRGSGEEARGRALYDGRAAVPSLGVFEGGLGIREYARLCQIADRLGLLSLATEYRAPWPGDASAIIEVRHLTGDHTVVDYGGQGPSELTALELALDGAAASIDWLPASSEK